MEQFGIVRVSPVSGPETLTDADWTREHNISSPLAAWTFGYTPGTTTYCLCCHREIVYCQGAERGYWRHNDRIGCSCDWHRVNGNPFDRQIK